MTSSLVRCVPLTIGVFCLLISIDGHAHGSHESRIQRSNQILDQERQQDQVDRLLLRADLHRRQQNWDAALQDYQTVASAEPNHPELMLGSAQLHLDRRQYAQAIVWARRLLAEHPDSARARIQLARAQLGVGQTRTAVTNFQHAVSQLSSPRPEHYVELAHMILSVETGPAATDRAIAAIDRGATVLGHPVSLHEVAYELEMQQGQFEAALVRTDAVLARSSALLNWQLRRGELLLRTEKRIQAQAALKELIQNIAELPAQRQNSRAFSTMLNRSQSLLAQAGQYGGESLTQ